MYNKKLVISTLIRLKKEYLQFILWYYLLFLTSICIGAGVNKSDNPYIIDRLTDKSGREIVRIIVPGSPPPAVRPPSVTIPKRNCADGINSLDSVPAFNWTYGCSATSAGMMMGYYDRNSYSLMYTGTTNSGVCPLDNSVWGGTTTGESGNGECPFIASHKGIDGLTTLGHVDDYWFKYGSIRDPYYGNWTPHNSVGTGDCLADFMGTNQFYPGDLHNVDGATIFGFYTNGEIYSPTSFGDGAYGMKLYAESKGYSVTKCFNQYIYEYAGTGKGFTFGNYKNEIDSGRPVIIQLKGHTVLGIGYNENGGSNIIYIHDTWDYNDHEMEWGGSYSGMQHYGVTVFRLTSSSADASVTVTSPDGGEKWAPGMTYKITWTSENLTGKVNIYLYKDNNIDSVISENQNNSGSYSWTIPSTQTISDAYKVRIASADNSKIYDESNAAFSISGTDAEVSLNKIRLNLFFSNTSDSVLSKYPVTRASSSSSAKDKIILTGGAWPVGTTPDKVLFNIAGWEHTCSDFEQKGNKYISTLTEESTKYTLSINTKKNLWDFKVSKAALFSDINFSDSQLPISVTIGNVTYSTKFSVSQLTTWKFSDTKNSSEDVSGTTTDMPLFTVNKAAGKYCNYKTGKDYFKITKGSISLSDTINISTDTVSISIDNASFGPYTLTQNNTAKAVYVYKSDSGTTPKISLKIDLDKSKWSFLMSKGDCEKIEGPDIDIILKIGAHTGAVKLNTSQKTKLSWKQQ